MPTNAPAHSNHPIVSVPATPVPTAVPAQPATLPTEANTNFVVHVCRNGPVDRKRIALTFDDGPHLQLTPKVLALLKEHQIKATFFVLGNQVKKHPEVLKMILKDGHEIGNHTYSHRLLSAMSRDLIEKEVKETQGLIHDATGSSTHLFRPPYGVYRQSTREILQQEGLHIVLWSVDPEDWRVRDSQKILNSVTNHVQNGSIIVCHDIYKTTVEALPEMLTWFKSAGYECVTISELCGLETK